MNMRTNSACLLGLQGAPGPNAFAAANQGSWGVWLLPLLLLLDVVTTSASVTDGCISILRQVEMCATQSIANKVYKDSANNISAREQPLQQAHTNTGATTHTPSTPWKHVPDPALQCAHVGVAEAALHEAIVLAQVQRAPVQIGHHQAVQHPLLKGLTAVQAHQEGSGGLWVCHTVVGGSNEGGWGGSNLLKCNDGSCARGTQDSSWQLLSSPSSDLTCYAPNRPTSNHKCQPPSPQPEQTKTHTNTNPHTQTQAHVPPGSL